MDDLDPIPVDPELLDGELSLAVRLTHRQALFVQEYLIDLNASQAALRCGYAAQSGSILLSQPGVVMALEAAKAQRVSRTGITQDQVLNEMGLLSFSDISHYIIDDEGQVALTEGAPRGAMRAVQSVHKKTIVRTDKDGSTTITYDVTLKLWDKPTPLRLMGRHVGLFPDRVELTGKGGGPIEAVTRVERRIVDPRQLEAAHVG